MLLILVFIACALLETSSYAQDGFSGVVVHVFDGDTVVVQTARKSVRVRLAAIDAPENSQAFGTKSKETLARAVFRRKVSVLTFGVDRYGRTVGTIIVGGHSVNRMMVDSGMAWVYRRYLVDRSLLRVEADARAARRGLWSDPHAAAPWEWRKARRGG